MRRLWLTVVFALLAGGVLAAQSSEPSSPKSGPGKNDAPPRSDREIEANESSSRDTRIDLSPPRGDSKRHPESAGETTGVDDSGDVQEMHPFNPHKAIKDIEVGDYYFKRKNYRAALDRYREALTYKPNDAVSTFRMGQCYEKMEDPDQAITQYEAYLKILPNGPFSADARKSLAKLKPTEQGTAAETPAK